MILKLNIEILVAVAFVFAATATAVYGSETALEIMDNHTKTVQSADKNVTAGAIDLKK